MELSRCGGITLQLIKVHLKKKKKIVQENELEYSSSLEQMRSVSETDY